MEKNKGIPTIIYIYRNNTGRMSFSASGEVVVEYETTGCWQCSVDALRHNCVTPTTRQVFGTDLQGGRR